MHPIRCLSVVVRGGADASDQVSVVVRGGADASDQVSVCGGPWWGRCIRSVVCGGPWWGRCIRSGVCLRWSMVADASDQVSVCGGPWWQMHPIRCSRWSVVGQMHPIRCLAKCCTAICLLAGMPDSSEMLVPQAGQVRGTTKKARRQKQMCHGT